MSLLAHLPCMQRTHGDPGDLIFTESNASLEQGTLPYTQLFWEAFPAASGPTDRTTYMFSYMDAGCVTM